MNDAARISSRMRDLLQHLKVSAEPLGWQVSLLSGLRTCAEQKKVNPTLPCSYHLSGDAIDVQLIFTALDHHYRPIAWAGYFSTAGKKRHAPSSWVSGETARLPVGR